MKLKVMFVTLLYLAVVIACSSGRREKGMFIGPSDLEKMMSKEDVVILDLRDGASFRAGHIPMATLVTPKDLVPMVEKLVGVKKPIITYCSCPGDSASINVALTLKNFGIEKVYVLKGGYPLWVEKNKPIARSGV